MLCFSIIYNLVVNLHTQHMPLPQNCTVSSLAQQSSHVTTTDEAIYATMHLVKVRSSAIIFPPKLGQHQGLLEQLSADVYMTVDPAPRKLPPPVVISVLQPAIRPQVYGGKVDAGGLVVPQKVTALVHGIVWVIWQQVCKHKTQALSPNHL